MRSQNGMNNHKNDREFAHRLTCNEKLVLKRPCAGFHPHGLQQQLFAVQLKCPREAAKILIGRLNKQLNTITIFPAGANN